MGESQIGITIVNQKEKAIYTDSKIGKNIKIKDLKDNNFGYLIFKIMVVIIWNNVKNDN